MAGTHTDISERKRTEAALLESQALLKRSAQLLEQSQAAARVGGWETDLRSGRVYWTDETFRIHETTPEEFSPNRDSVYRFYDAENRSRLHAAAELAIRTGVPYSLELELTTARQHRRHVHCTGVAERENGRTVKLYGSFRDVTADRRAERDREELRLKMLEAQKLESLGVLAGGIAHDFNNLLTVILANASFIRDAAGPHEQRLVHIETAAQRAADLCRQMLAYAGKAGFVAGPVDLAALVRDTAELIHVSLSKKASLTLDFPAALPPVDGDASQLRQVVMNLVINASEALGDHPGRISLSAGRDRPAAGAPGQLHTFDLPAGDCVCLEVADTGHGMDAATLNRIFEPFFTTKFTGRGLGLPAVLGIVRTHRGALYVESAPGRGTTFRVYLPAAAAPATSHAPAPPPAGGAAGAGRLLIADDEAGVLETTDLLLRHFGYETVLAVDGDEAVRRFRSSPESFTAVLMDLTMPGLDGADALREIRAIRPGVPALVMSGFSEADVLHRLHGLGDVPILRKPFSRQILLDHIVKLGPGATLR
jgi:signal transduction histidine kinase/CheY-like chemotaxis protein